MLMLRSDDFTTGFNEKKPGYISGLYSFAGDLRFRRTDISRPDTARYISSGYLLLAAQTKVTSSRATPGKN
jgi:hypothetical protein